MTQSSQTRKREESRLSQLRSCVERGFELLYHIACIPFVLLFLFCYFCVTISTSLIKPDKKDRLYYRTLKESGRILEWKEVQSRLENHEGSLILEAIPKGIFSGWWVPDNRSTVDPDEVLPSWQEYVEYWDTLSQASGNGSSHEESEYERRDFDKIDQWFDKNLKNYKETACLTHFPLRRFRETIDKFPQETLLVLPFFCHSLSDLIYDDINQLT